MAKKTKAQIILELESEKFRKGIKASQTAFESFSKSGTKVRQNLVTTRKVITTSKDSFNSLGKATTTLKNKLGNLSKQLTQSKNKFGEITKSATKTKAAFDSLGKATNGGLTGKMGNLEKQTGRTRAELEQVGVTAGKVYKTYNEFSDALVAASNTADDLHKDWSQQNKTLKQYEAILRKVNDALDTVSEDAQEYMSHGKDMFGTELSNAKLAYDAYRKLGGTQDQLIEKIQAMEKATDQNNTATKKSLTSINDLNQEIQDQEKIYNALASELAKAEKVTDKLHKSVLDLQDAGKANTSTFEKLQEKYKTTYYETDKLWEKTQKAKKALKVLKEQSDKTGQGMKSMGKETREAANTLCGNLKQKTEKANAATITFSKTLTNLGVKTAKTKKQKQELIKTIQELIHKKNQEVKSVQVGIDAFEGNIGVTNRLMAQYDELESEVWDLSGDLTKLENSLGKVADTQKEATQSTTDALSSINSLNQAIQEQEQTLSDLNSQYSKSKKEAKNLEDEIDALEDALWDMQDAGDLSTDSLDALKKEFNDTNKTTKELATKITTAEKKLDELKSSSDKTAKAMKSMGKETRDTANTLCGNLTTKLGAAKSALVQFFSQSKKTESAVDSLGNSTTQAGNDMTKFSSKTKRTTREMQNLEDTAHLSELSMASMGKSLKEVAEGIGGLSDQIFGFQEKIIALERSRFGLEQTTLDLKRTEEDYVAALQNGTVVGQELKRMEEDLLMLRKDHAIEIREVEAEQMALNSEFANFGFQLGGVIAQTGTTVLALKSAIAAEQTATGTTSLLSLAKLKLAGATTVASGALGVLRGALTAVATHPIVLPLTAISAAFIALDTNVGGVRQAMHDFIDVLQEAWKYLKWIFPAIGLVDEGLKALGINVGENIDTWQEHERVLLENGEYVGVLESGFNSLNDTLGGKLIPTTAEAAETEEEYLAKLKDGIVPTQTLTTETGNLTTGLDSVAGSFSLAGGSTADLEKALSTTNSQISATATGIAKLESELAQYNDAQTRTSPKAKELRDKINELKKSMEAGKSKAEQYAKAIAEIKKEAYDTAKGIDSLNSHYKALAGGVLITDKSLTGLSSTLQTQQQALIDARKDLWETKDALKELEDAGKGSSAEAEGLRDRISELTKTIDTGQKVVDDLTTRVTNLADAEKQGSQETENLGNELGSLSDEEYFASLEKQASDWVSEYKSQVDRFGENSDQVNQWLHLNGKKYTATVKEMEKAGMHGSIDKTLSSVKALQNEGDTKINKFVDNTVDRFGDIKDGIEEAGKAAVEAIDNQTDAMSRHEKARSGPSKVAEVESGLDKFKSLIDADDFLTTDSSALAGNKFFSFLQKKNPQMAMSRIMAKGQELIKMLELEVSGLSSDDAMKKYESLRAEGKIHEAELYAKHAMNQNQGMTVADYNKDLFQILGIDGKSTNAALTSLKPVIQEITDEFKDGVLGVADTTLGTFQLAGTNNQGQSVFTSVLNVLGEQLELQKSAKNAGGNMFEGTGQFAGLEFNKYEGWRLFEEEIIKLHDGTEHTKKVVTKTFGAGMAGLEKAIAELKNPTPKEKQHDETMEDETEEGNKETKDGFEQSDKNQKQTNTALDDGFDTTNENLESMTAKQKAQHDDYLTEQKKLLDQEIEIYNKTQEVKDKIADQLEVLDKMEKDGISEDHPQYKKQKEILDQLLWEKTNLTQDGKDIKTEIGKINEEIKKFLNTITPDAKDDGKPTTPTPPPATPEITTEGKTPAQIQAEIESQMYGYDLQGPNQIWDWNTQRDFWQGVADEYIKNNEAVPEEVSKKIDDLTYFLKYGIGDKESPHFQKANLDVSLTTGINLVKMAEKRINELYLAGHEMTDSLVQPFLKIIDQWRPFLQEAEDYMPGANFDSGLLHGARDWTQYDESLTEQPKGTQDNPLVTTPTDDTTFTVTNPENSPLQTTATNPEGDKLATTVSNPEGSKLETEVSTPEGGSLDATLVNPDPIPTTDPKSEVIDTNTKDTAENTESIDAHTENIESNTSDTNAILLRIERKLDPPISTTVTNASTLYDSTRTNT